MTWDVAIMRPIDEAGVEILDEFAEITWLSEYEDWEAFLEDIGRFEAIVHRQVDLTADVIERGTSLKIISKHGVGLDQIDVRTATERGILVTNTPGANARAVAEHTISLVLAVRKQLLRADRDLRGGEWDRERYKSHEYESDVLGVYGCGDIGSRVVRMAQGLDMSTVAFDPYIEESAMPAGVTKVRSKSELFEESDVVCLHTPLTEETRGAVSRAELRQLSETGIIVNTSRGGLIDQAALVEALEAGRIAGAGIDVFADEPPSPDDPLFDLENAVVTPHIAGTTVESARGKSRGAAENIRAAYQGTIPETAVNADAIEDWSG